MVITEVVSLMEVSWRWSFYRRENGYVIVARLMVVVSLMEGECSCYRGGQFNEGRMVMLRR